MSILWMQTQSHGDPGGRLIWCVISACKKSRGRQRLPNTKCAKKETLSIRKSVYERTLMHACAQAPRCWVLLSRHTRPLLAAVQTWALPGIPDQRTGARCGRPCQLGHRSRHRTPHAQDTGPVLGRTVATHATAPHPRVAMPLYISSGMAHGEQSDSHSL